MEFVQMKCPNCNADLDVENSLDTFYCKYCGTKIMLEGQSRHVVKAKTKMHIVDKIGEMQKEYHREKEEVDKRSSEKLRKAAPWFIGFMLLMFGILFFIGFMAEASDNREEQRLQTIYAEIQADIAAGNYIDAKVKTNSLHYTGGGSGDRKKWDKIREGIIEIIDDLEKPS